MRRLPILARPASPSDAYLVSHQGLRGTYGNLIFNGPLLRGRARNVSESERPQTPQRARLTESTLLSSSTLIA